MTGLRVTDGAFGWLKLTVSCGATETPCQLMIALLLDWWMLVVFPAWEMAAEPSTTVPPRGSATAGLCSSINAAAAVSVTKGPCDLRGRWQRRSNGNGN